MPGTGLRWGIAGYGDVVRRRALPALRSLSENVACVWGRDGGRARALAEEFGVPVGTADFSDLISSADVVYVATPVSAHLPLASAAIEAGKPVLVEKPLGALTTPKGVLPAAGPTVGVAYYRRLAPALIRLKRLVAGRAVHTVSMTFRSAFDPAPDDPKHWRTDPAVAGGGVLADVGSHRLDLLLWLLGRPALVDADIGPRFKLGAERAARVRLSWPSGTRAELALDWTGGPPQDRLELDFDGGQVVLDPLDSGRISGNVDGIALSELMPPAANPHAPLLENFARSVLSGVAPVCPAADGLAVDRLIATAYTLEKQ